MNPMANVRVSLVEVRGLDDVLNAVIPYVSQVLPGLLNAAKKAVICVATLCCKLGTLEHEMDALWLMKENLETHMSLKTEEPPGQRDRLTGWVGQVEALNDQVPRPGAPRSRTRCWVSRAILLYRVLSMYETGAELVVPPPSSYPPPVVFWGTAGKRLHPGDALVRVRDLLATDTRLLGVTGRPRIGKTSLLQEINNGLADLPARSNGYGVVIWVTVSREPNLSKIQMEIGARLGLSGLSAEGDVTSQSATLRRVLTRRRFLLLLDDVWAPLNWEQLGIPRGQRGAKLVFATPIDEICSGMNPDESVPLEPLGDVSSWRLFWDTINRPNLEEKVKRNWRWLEHSENLIKLQGGVPAAIVLLAETMLTDKRVAVEEFWPYFTSQVVLASPPFQMGTQETAIWMSKFGLLRDQERECFLYCSLFPCGYEIDKRQLVDYWISEDFILDDGSDTLRQACWFIIGQLRKASWLSNSSCTAAGKVRMDKDPHHFAISQHGEKHFVVSADRGLESVPDIGRWSAAERVSFMGNRIRSLPTPGQCQSLRTLFVSRNRDLNFEANGEPNDAERRPEGIVADTQDRSDAEISSDPASPSSPPSSVVMRTFFSGMDNLRVLDLSFTSVDALPSDIQMLAQLRYLNLSHTKISSLPREVGCLRKLRHLDLSCTGLLSEIPAAEISQLKQLVTLNLYDSKYNLFSTVDGETEQGCRGRWLLILSRLKELGVSMYDIQLSLEISIPPLYMSLSGFIKFLMLKGSPECARGELNLLEPQLGVLEALKLWDIPLSTLVLRSQLQGLRRLHIQGCHQMQDIRWAQQLPALEEIHVQDCRGIQNLLAPERDGRMEELTEIHLQDLPRLKTIYSRSWLHICGKPKRSECYFPSLREFTSRECPSLKKPCFNTEDAPNLKPHLFG